MVIFQLTACAELQQVVNQLPNGMITNDQIAAGLKEALNNGVTNQVSKLAIEDGFFKNELTRILLPEELQETPDKLYDRILMVCSYIASMSDGYAIVLHKKIKGDLI